MAVKVKVETLENSFVILRGDKREEIAGERGIETASAVRAILGQVKSAGTLQNAYTVFLHGVLNRPLCDSVKGKGDLTTGKLDKNARAIIRQAEIAYLNELYAAGVKGIPADESARIALSESIRNDGNYSNIKNTVVRYLAFCGKYPMTGAGFVVPKAVMQAEISSILNVEPPDDSPYAQLLAIKAALDKVTLPEDQARKAEPLARELASILKGLCAHYDELATNTAHSMPPTASSVPAVASEAIGKMRRVPRPAVADALV